MGNQSRMNGGGQVTLPDDVWQLLGLSPGDIVAFEQADGSVRVAKGAEADQPSFEDKLARARALANPLPLGMTTDQYMSWIREPLPPYDE